MGSCSWATHTCGRHWAHKLGVWGLPVPWAQMGTENISSVRLKSVCFGIGQWGSASTHCVSLDNSLSFPALSVPNTHFTIVVPQWESLGSLLNKIPEPQACPQGCWVTRCGMGSDAHIPTSSLGGLGCYVGAWGPCFEKRCIVRSLWGLNAAAYTPGWCSVRFNALPFINWEMPDFTSRHLGLNVRLGTKTAARDLTSCLTFLAVTFLLTCTCRFEGIFSRVSHELLYEKNAL